MSSQVISAMSPVVTGTGRSKTTVYTATKVTGPTGNPPQYKSEIIQYDDAKGFNQTTIGTRDPQTGKITWNDNASNKIKLNSKQFEQASAGQIKSVQGALANNAVQKDALNKSAGKGNSAQGSGDIQSPPTTSGGDANEFPKKGKVKTRSDFGGSSNPLTFPIDMPSTRDTIKFKMMEYRPSGFGTGDSIGQAGTRAKGKIIGSVLLPIPAGISDTNSVGWGQDSMSPIQAAGAAVAMGIIDEDQKTDGMGQISAALEKIKANNPEVRKGLEGMITGAATGLNQQALQRGEGMIMNPNMELLFNGPSLRSFGFTFKLSPRSPQEAQKVIQIIRFFKQGMAVIRSESEFFLKAPHTFQLEYLNAGSPHKYLNKFKECALQNATVQYTPDGNYNTFSDGVMNSYSMQLTFNELEPIFNDDYEKDTPRDAIGY